MALTYAGGHDLLDAWVRARTSYDGDAFVALFTELGELTLDPFVPPLAGHNALRAYLGQAAVTERHLDLAMERHWVAGQHVLAAWHASWTRPADEAKVRQAGFLSAEVGEDGRIERLRTWTVTREFPAG